MLSTHEKVVNDLTRCATCYKAEELEIKKKNCYKNTDTNL